LLSVKRAQTCILNVSLDCKTKIIELMLLKEVSPQLRLFDQKYFYDLKWLHTHLKDY